MQKDHSGDDFTRLPCLTIFPVNLMNYRSHYQTSSRRNNSLLANAAQGSQPKMGGEGGGGLITFNWLQLLTSGLAGYKAVKSLNNQ